MDETIETAVSQKTDFDFGKEFVALRSQILSAIKEARSLEKYVIVTVAGLWVWLITHHVTNRWPWTIPVAVVVVASLRALGIMQHLGVMGQYIRENLEPSNRGFEHFLKKKREKATIWRRIVRLGSDYGSWILLLALTVVAPIWGPELVASIKTVNR